MLTRIQRRVVAYSREYEVTYSKLPTTYDIAAYLGLSRDGAYWHVSRLAKKGIIVNRKMQLGEMPKSEIQKLRLENARLRNEVDRLLKEQSKLLGWQAFNEKF